MKFLLSITIMLVTSFFVNAQPNDPPQNPDDVVPITGIEYLLLSGGAYGIYRFSKKSSKKTDDT